MRYAAIVMSSITIPGDERSRTNPGHGYPEHEEQTIAFHEFDTEEQLRAWVQKTESERFSKPKYRVIRFEELSVKTELKVDLQRLVI